MGTSNIKKYSDLQKEFGDCKTEEQQVERELEQTTANIAKSRQNIAEKKKIIEAKESQKDETHEVYYRDWYKLWLGGHNETEYKYDRAAMQTEIDEIEAEACRLEGEMDAGNQSKEEKERLKKERIEKTKKAQADFQALEAALKGKN